MQSTNNDMRSNIKKQYVMFDLFPQNNDIWYFENTVSCPEKLIEFIEECDTDPTFFSKIPQWEKWTASDDPQLIYGYKKNILLESSKVESGIDFVDRRSLYIINSLRMASDLCFDKYMSHRGINKDEYYLNYSILPLVKWIPGAQMGPHCDSSDDYPDLRFSIVTYLNNNYEGGEIYFPNHNIKIKPKAGSSIMFPAYEPFVHQVLPIQSGQRYAISVSVIKK